MKIQQGKYRGRSIFSGGAKRGGLQRNLAEKGLTPSLVKKSIMDAIRIRIDNPTEWDFFDLFAGSGQVGYEAYSLGFGRIFFCDTDLLAVRSIRQQCEQITSLWEEREQSNSTHENLKIFHKDFMRMASLIRSGKKAVLFLDMPYNEWETEMAVPCKLSRFYSLILAHPEVTLAQLMIFVQGPKHQPYIFPKAEDSIWGHLSVMETKYRKIGGQRISFISLQEVPQKLTGNGESC